MGVGDISGYHVNDGNVSAGTGRTSDADGVSQRDAVSAAAKDLNAAPGDIISGKITMSDSGNIQLKLSDNTVLNAHVNENIRLTEGETLSFQVKSNDNGLVLSPLGTNTAAGASAEQALRSAQLDITQNSIQMVTQMMREGMSVDTASLQSMNRLVSEYPAVDMTEIIQLKHMNVEVNTDNIGQLKNYKNAQYRIEQGVGEISDSLTDEIDDLVLQGHEERSASMYKDLLGIMTGTEAEQTDTLQAAQTDTTLINAGTKNADNVGSISYAAADDMPAGNYLGSETLSKIADIVENAGIISKETADSIRNGTIGVRELLNVLKDALTVSTETAGQPETGKVNVTVKVTADGIRKVQDDQEIKADTGTVNSVGDKVPVSGNEETGRISTKMTGYAQREQQTGERSVTAAVSLNDPIQPFLKLLQSEPMKKLIQDVMARQFQITPSDAADKDSVRQLYDRITKQTDALQNMLVKNNMSDSQAAVSVQNLRSNVDFINQINQTFSYVQLPVKLTDGNAHGDLYVYTNKKNLAQKDGTVTALLHLDMANLGPMDIYIAMNRTNHVNTHFYLQDDESLELIAAHIDELDRHLADRGYMMTSEISLRKEMTQAADEIVSQNRSVSRMVSYSSFDARA